MSRINERGGGKEGKREKMQWECGIAKRRQHTLLTLKGIQWARMLFVGKKMAY